MAGKQLFSVADVERMLASSGLPTTSTTMLMTAQATAMAKANEPQADPLKAKKEAALASAASFALPAVSRAFEPCCLEPARSWALSEALTTVLKDVVAVCPDEAASLKVVIDGVKGFYGGASASVMRRYQALVNSTHNLKPGLLSSMPPEVLERIMMHVPPKLVVGRTCVSSLSSAMACKALAQACTVNTALIELTWTIDNFLMLGDDRIFGPEDGVENLGRKWNIFVCPKGFGLGKGTHVSVYLHGTDSDDGSDGRECYRSAIKMEVPLSAPAISSAGNVMTSPICTFSGNGRGFPSFIPLADLTAPTKTILQNGSLTIEVTARLWRVASP